MQYSKSSCESSSSSLDSPRLAFGSPTQPFPDFVAYISLASGCTCTTRFIRKMTARPSSRFSGCGMGVGIQVHRYSELTPNRRVYLTGAPAGYAKVVSLRQTSRCRSTDSRSGMWLRSSKPLGRIALAGKVPGLEGISRAEGASGFLQSQRSSFDVSAGNLNVRF